MSRASRCGRVLHGVAVMNTGTPGMRGMTEPGGARDRVEKECGSR